MCLESTFIMLALLPAPHPSPLPASFRKAAPRCLPAACAPNKTEVAICWCRRQGPAAEGFQFLFVR